jgi:hypothetical protein
VVPINLAHQNPATNCCDQTATLIEIRTMRLESRQFGLFVKFVDCVVAPVLGWKSVLTPIHRAIQAEIALSSSP